MKGDKIDSKALRALKAEKIDDSVLRANILQGVSPLLVDGGALGGAQMSIREIMLRIWHGKWIVVATVVVAVAMVSIWMKSKDPRYTATMVVAPASDGGASGLSSRLSQYSGIAALAGIDLSSNEVVTPFTQFSAVMTSPIVAERLQQKYDIMPKIFAASWHWDPETKVWSRREGLLTPIKGWVRGFFDLPDRRPPTANSLAGYLYEELSTSQIGTTGMRRIEFQHKDAIFAVQLLAALHRETDAVIREAAEARTSHQIAYIERKLQTVTAADHRRSLVQLLLDQEKQMMMIQVDLPFAARIIEPPISSDQPTFPRPRLFLAAAIVLGGILGVSLIFLIDALRPEPTPEPFIDGHETTEETTATVNGSAETQPESEDKKTSPPIAAMKG